VTTLPNGLYIRGVDPAEKHWRRSRRPAAPRARDRAIVRRGAIAARRALIQQQKLDEGLRLVEQGGDRVIDRTIRYFGYLFAGDALLTLDRAADSRDSYQRAIELYPHCASGRAWGSRAALRSLSDGSQALDAMLPSLTKDPETRRATIRGGSITTATASMREASDRGAARAIQEARR
jgi:hypothetical protein